ncbi:MAG: pyridoxal-phosphate dependent enzyme, partial [Candidatus Hodarchaeales archaeon]|jgi:threonine synthase
MVIPIFEQDLKCPKCQKTYDLDSWLKDSCGFRLRVNYDKEARNRSISKEDYQTGSITHWKYKKFFPVKDEKNIISIGEGGTSLVKSKRLTKDFGLNQLYFKLEHTNPSGSFKDRPISVGASVGLEQRTKVLSAASSGNAAASLASFGAKAGINTVVFVPDRSSQSKVSQLITLGATVVRVSAKENEEGDPSVKLFRDSVEKWGWTPCPSFGPFNPFQFEGTKSLAFET